MTMCRIRTLNRTKTFILVMCSELFHERCIDIFVYFFEVPEQSQSGLPLHFIFEIFATMALSEVLRKDQSDESMLLFV
jgi:hypothetical protein